VISWSRPISSNWAADPSGMEERPSSIDLAPLL
jgi:hypothetical protein